MIEGTNLKSLVKLQETNVERRQTRQKKNLCKLNKIIEDERQKNSSIHQILLNLCTIRLEKNSSQRRFKNSSQLHEITRCLSEENAIDYALKKSRSFQQETFNTGLPVRKQVFCLLKQRMWVFRKSLQGTKIIVLKSMPAMVVVLILETAMQNI